MASKSRLRGRSYDFARRSGYAIRLEREFGLSSLAKQIADGSLTAAIAVIEETSTYPLLEVNVLDALESLIDPLLRYLTQLAGIDPDKPQTEKTEGKTQPLADYLQSLYKLGNRLAWMVASSDARQHPG